MASAASAAAAAAAVTAGSTVSTASLPSSSSGNPGNDRTAQRAKTRGQLERAADSALADVRDYSKLQIEATLDEYKLLEELNRVAAARYSQVADTVDSLSGFAEAAAEQRKSLEPLLSEIDSIEAVVTSLEGAAELLNTHVSRIEAKAREL